ncbi:glycosyltransferase family 4 protein [Sanguibacter antarcticus]|uniref:D-inositol 3-phosphate glycosyltransferase n=1 Tax=Sanguibacter antarcticus TaxID=372484 RepID=A0A2A9E6P7_9MICO|nr:glycosyltransferase family 4 protein [Sanguibacter antarcticus]PFG34326.1 phosphatidylinositol alpha-mannosyltransferase [Sanguibacter antarcticus]
MSETLRIGLVIDDSLDRPDGVQQHVLTLGAWLTAQGHEVHYLTSTTRRSDLVNVHSLARNLRLRFNGNRLGIPLPAPARGIDDLLRATPFDVLHVNMPYSPLLAGRVVARAQARTVVVGTFHILPWTFLTQWGTRLLGLVQRRQLRRFARVVAVSRPAADFAAEALRVEPVVIGNPVEVSRFSRARDAEHARTSSAPASDALMPDAPVRIVFLGRLVERKGAIELLRAVVRMRALTTRPVHVVLGGTGPLKDALQALVRDNDLGGSVELVGYVTEDDKAALLAGADIVALPSTGGESFGISVVEALAASRGVVLAGDNPGYRTVMDGLEDQLVDATDTGAFAALLARFVDDADARAAASERQVAAAARFDVDVIGTQILDVYRAAGAAGTSETPAAPRG